MAAGYPMVTKHCALCGDAEVLEDLYPNTCAEAALTPSVFSARRDSHPMHYRMVRCRSCGLVFSREIYPDSYLQDLYAHSAVTFEAYTSTLRQDYWAPLAQHVSALDLSSALEIGCSTGFFLEELLVRGFRRVAGCEPSQEAIAKASPNVSPSIRPGFFDGKKTFGSERFSLICSFHTLDHVSDPRSILAKCCELLIPGGWVYYVVHDVDALQAKLLGEKSPIIDIEHIYLFNKKTLKHLLENAGLEVVALANFWNSYPIEYWVRMLPINQKLKRWIQNALVRLGLKDFAPPIPAGNIYVLARLPNDGGG